MMNNFNSYLTKWNLKKDGEAIITPSSYLLPVIWENQSCMLKIPSVEEERLGCQLMVWWQGQGAAKVFLTDGKAIVLQHANGNKSLLEMVKNNQDNEATTIICSVVEILHSANHQPLPTNLVPLSQWFKSLNQAAKQQGGIFAKASLIAEKLLEEKGELRVLHGDIHHQNILDFGDQGWLAIDPKGLFGNRYFDYANILCNPDYNSALAPGRLERQAKLISLKAGLDYHQFLQWILVYASLSAAWHLEEGSSPDLALKVANLSDSLI